jgi:hypothetical protein
VRKDPAWYRLFFPGVPDDLPYTWPDGLYPSWPMDAAPPPGGAAADLLARTARELRDGRDVTWQPEQVPAGSPAHLAARTVLTLPPPALWISQHAGEPSGPGEVAEEQDAMLLSAETIAATRQSPVTGRRSAAARPAPVRTPTAKAPTDEDLAVVAQEVSRFRSGTYGVVVHCPRRLAEPGIRAALLAAPPSVIVMATGDPAALDAVRASCGPAGPPPILRPALDGTA